MCIGNEILVNPSLLFLDEPTSGLDSTTALRIVQVLTEIAEVINFCSFDLPYQHSIVSLMHLSRPAMDMLAAVRQNRRDDDSSTI